jgi:methylglutaconyl-CoA hydratase
MAKHFGTTVTVKREDSMAIATLNRPDKLNAINRDLLEEFGAFLDVTETDKTVRCVIITAAGDKAFCVGADLKERQAMTEKDILQRFDQVHKLYTRLENLHVPVIAAINGAALGGGLELALACDFRILAKNAVVGLPEVSLAIIPGNGGTQRLTRVIGMSKAMELILMARRLSADEAFAAGIVSKAVPPGQALAEAKSWATTMGEMGPLALAAAKRAIRRGIELPMAKALELEAECYKTLLGSKDRKEGIVAFLDKRKPKYIGE